MMFALNCNYVHCAVCARLITFHCICYVTIIHFSLATNRVINIYGGVGT